MGRMNVRNMQPFWYALNDGVVEDYDDYGNQIGTHATYGEPVEARGNISAAMGYTMARQFGDLDDYDRVIVLGDRDTPINEYAVLWIDCGAPETDLWGRLQTDDSGNYKTPWNYVVRKVGRGLPGVGGAIIAIHKVTVA